jgi:hypothetical protein
MNDDLKNLVIARIDQLPAHMKVSIGNSGSLTKDDMIRNVREETPIGEKLAKIQVDYIKSLIKK